MKFEYVNVVGKGCDGWLNLFFDGICIALVNDVEIADKIRSVTPKMLESLSDDQKEKMAQDEINDYYIGGV